MPAPVLNLDKFSDLSSDQFIPKIQIDIFFNFLFFETADLVKMRVAIVRLVRYSKEKKNLQNGKIVATRRPGYWRHG